MFKYCLILSFSIILLNLKTSNSQSIYQALNPKVEPINDRQINVELPANDLLVDVEGIGKIAGLPDITIYSGKIFAQFLGIPYGKAAEGNLRFQPTIPFGRIVNENETFLAHKYASPCMQLNFGGSENCLALNIFSHIKRENQTLMPVIIYIYGGTFLSGSGEVLTGTRLLERDVVLVTFNYRMNSLGFFNLNNNEAPGNAGLYDSFEVLQWVKSHIKAFGGNPNLITIAGQSSGAAFVTHLLGSPLAKGLFHRAIALSGSVSAAWAYQLDATDKYLEIASAAGCKLEELNNDFKLVAECLHHLSFTQLNTAFVGFFLNERMEGRIGLVASSPTVQTNNSLTIPRMIEKDPKEIFENMEQSNIPLMIGATRHDGSGSVVDFWEYFMKPRDLLEDEDFLRNELIPISLKAFDIEENLDEIGDLYFGDQKYSGNWTLMLPGLIDLLGVYGFKKPVYDLAKVHSKLSPTFLYSFDYKGEESSHNDGGSGIPGGVGHSDDVMYLRRKTLFRNPADERISKQFVDIWANFAEFGNPNGVSEIPNWPMFNETNESFLKFDHVSEIQQNWPETWPNSSLELFP